MFIAAFNTTNTPLLVALLGIYVAIVKVLSILQSRVYDLYPEDVWSNDSSSR